MEAMKIMIGYDGSSHADAALADLRRAGLPRKVEAMALSVSEEWIPAPASLGGVATSFPRFESEAEEEALKLARSAKAALKTLFPDWQVHAEAVTGSPGNMLIWKSDEWKPDLIVVGSQGRTALGTILLRQRIAESPAPGRLFRAHRPRQQKRPTRARAIDRGRGWIAGFGRGCQSDRHASLAERKRGLRGVRNVGSAARGVGTDGHRSREMDRRREDPNCGSR